MQAHNENAIPVLSSNLQVDLADKEPRRALKRSAPEGPEGPRHDETAPKRSRLQAWFGGPVRALGALLGNIKAAPRDHTAKSNESSVESHVPQEGAQFVAGRRTMLTARKKVLAPTPDAQDSAGAAECSDSSAHVSAFAFRTGPFLDETQPGTRDNHFPFGEKEGLPAEVHAPVAASHVSATLCPPHAAPLHGGWQAEVHASAVAPHAGAVTSSSVACLINQFEQISDASLRERRDTSQSIISPGVPSALRETDGIAPLLDMAPPRERQHVRFESSIAQDFPDLLHVLPERQVDFATSSTAVVTIINVSNDCVAFKFKASSPACLARPAGGTLPPGARQDVKLSLGSAFRGKSVNEKYLIQAIAVRYPVVLSREEWAMKDSSSSKCRLQAVRHVE